MSGTWRYDLQASLTVTFLDIPQAVAYAMIAGLPPVMGLYAAAVPAIAGSLVRSSHHVVTGPSNALSLLAGTTIAAAVSRGGGDPMTVAVTLAFLVGLFQVVAGLLRLDVLVDYVSNPVVLGYIAGAAVLIAIGQLPNVTLSGTTGPEPFSVLRHWLAELPRANPPAVALAVGTAVLVLGARRIDRRIPGPILAMLGGLLLSEAFGLRAHGIRVLEDLAPIPRGLPPLTIPDLATFPLLAAGAVACAVLSLVESSSVARAIAFRSGQRLEMTKEFTGQGIANLAAGLFGGYPVSGSLARSTLNYQSGARSRLSAVLCGVSMLVVLLFLGPLLGKTPIPCLAGLLLVVAADLIDVSRIRLTMSSIPSDRLSFLATLIGTWTLPLDQAIYLGVGISLVLFLRRARLLSMRELAIGERGGFREIEPQLGEQARSCPAIRIMNLTGPVFFAMAGELEDALEPLLADREIRVLIIRMRQTQMLDVTTLSVLEEAAKRLAADGRHLLLLGLRPPLIAFLERTGAAARIGRSNLFPLEPGWFSAMSAALRTALAMVGDHACGSACPFRQYLETVSGERQPPGASAPRE